MLNDVLIATYDINKLPHHRVLRVWRLKDMLEQ